MHAYDARPRPDAVLHLAGLAWPGERPLAGHSDADVAAHAAADALLSAAGLGDLGSNFGTSEPQWAGAAGATLLAEAARRVRDAGFDDRQRGGPGDREPARRSVSGARRPRRCSPTAAGAPVSASSATTTDGLGLTGRGEGVAAIATALVVLAPADAGAALPSSTPGDHQRAPRQLGRPTCARAAAATRRRCRPRARASRTARRCWTGGVP